MKSATLLITSHLPALQKQLSEVLERNYYQTATSPDCETTIGKCLLTPPDICILDISSLDSQAQSCWTAINHHLSGDIPFLFLGASEFIPLSVKDAKPVFFDTVELPLHEATLLLRITNLLELAASRKKIADYHEQLHHEVITRDRLTSAIHQLRDAILIIDQQGKIVYANPACKGISGYTPDELINRKLQDIQMNDEDENRITELLSSPRTGASWHGTMHNRRKDGSLYLEEIDILPIPCKDGKINGHIIIKKDITEQRRMESITRSVNLMENVGFVFSGIRHELGNPVNSLKMTLSVLSKKLHQFSTETILDFLDRSQHEINRIEYLLHSLRSFSLFEQPVFKSVQVKPFLEKILLLHRQDMERKQIQLQISIDDAATTVLADERALHQVLLNLLTNAINALTDRQKGVIKLSASRESENLIRLSVEDNGCGISKEHQAMLFKPFFTTRPDGTGMGLVIVQKMLAEMNCSISLESAESLGSTFSILLPEGGLPPEHPVQ